LPACAGRAEAQSHAIHHAFGEVEWITISFIGLFVVVAGLAERAGQPIRFLLFMLMAFPLMLMSIVVSRLYLQLRYL
jgi:Na+/H+ antiporter NhaD/arsenite permease-like protein